MAWLERLRVFGVEERGAHWMARPLPADWLAVAARGAGGPVIALADDVPGHLVAAAVRHVLTDHANDLTVVCRAPECGAGQQWRGAAPVDAVASTA